MDSLCFRESPAVLPDDPAFIHRPDVGAMMIDARLMAAFSSVTFRDGQKLRH